MTTATKKVLLVDHDVLFRTTLSQIFRERGYSVRSAPDGISALADIWDELPDILLTDLNMPDMSGYALLSEVHKYFPGILTVAMTSAVLEDTVSRDIDAAAYYSKATNLKYLLRMVNALANTGLRLPAPGERSVAKSSL
jgi:CheY-like chemotaxis protein